VELLENSPKPISFPPPDEGPKDFPEPEAPPAPGPAERGRRHLGGSLNLKGVGKRLRKVPKRIAAFPFKTRRRKIAFFSLLTLITLLLLLILALPFFLLYPAAKELKPAAGEFQTALASHNLDTIQSALTSADEKFSRLERNYYRLSYFRVFPLLNRYYQDGVHLVTSARLFLDSTGIVVSSLKPYEEVLGLKEGFGSQITVEQQLANFLDTLPKLGDEMDQVWGNLLLIQKELAEVDPQRYPEEIRGIQIRFWIEEANKIFAETRPLIEQGRSLLELVPEFLGSSGPRTYLIIFQNDAELRATGGFMTAISFLTISDGKVLENEVYPGTYAHPYQKREDPPAPLGKYLGVPRWYFHDMNYSPDLPTSARKMKQVWEAARLPKINGIVMVNTETAADLLKVTGPLDVPYYNIDLANSGLPDPCKKGGPPFTSENLVCRLEFYVEKSPYKTPGEKVKRDLLGKLSDAVIGRISSSSAEIWPQLIDLVFAFLNQRSVMIHSFQPPEQELLSELGYAGEVEEFSGDYFLAVDSNFGGRKTDMFIDAEMKQTLERQEDGTWRKTVELKYHNPQPHDNWLSSGYRDFVRLYVPKGSRLVSVGGASAIWTSPSAGSNKVANPAGWEEFGKTVFGAFFTFKPEETKTVTFVYDLPASVGEGIEESGEYRLFIQKQSGTNIGLVSVQIGGTIESVELETDQILTLPVSD